MDEMPTSDVIDVAIIGGGISGTYAAWRLATESKLKKIHLYELSDRIGGRLLSVPIPGMPNIQAELGGMFFCEYQAIVWQLIKLLNLTPISARLETTDPLAYVRDRRLRMSEFRTSDIVPYNLRPDERGLDYGGLFGKGVASILVDRPLSPEYFSSLLWQHDRETIQVDGQYLYNLSIWEALLKVLSPEAYRLCLDTGFFYSDLGTWNAASAIATSFSLPSTETWYTLGGGYQKLPETLAARFEERGGMVYQNHRLLEFERLPSGLLKLIFSDRGVPLPPVLAKHLILAMPKRSLELLAQKNSNNFLFSNPTFLHNIQTVTGDPAYKLFLGYSSPWWRDLQLFAGCSATDLPMRKCYYFGSEADYPESEPNNQNSLLLANFPDGYTAGFWQSMAYDPQAPRRRAAFVGKSFSKPPLLNTFLKSDGTPQTEALIASSDMVRTAQQQLKALHNLNDIPEPYTALYLDWEKDPYGGGWHSWNPRCKPWNIMKQMRRPLRNANVYICGEAYSNMQGWVQGALNSAELMLEENFNLSRPNWLPVTYDLGS